MHTLPGRRDTKDGVGMDFTAGELQEKADCNGCGYRRSKTGSGPTTQNHDNTIYGVSDLNGNVWEWLAGLRLLDGVIEHIPNNDTALTGGRGQQRKAADKDEKGTGKGKG